MQNTLFLEKPNWPLNPSPGTVKPRDYQSQPVVKIVSDFYGERSRKQLIILATGLGKGITMGMIADWCFKDLKKPVLMLAHREELLEQVAHEFSLVFGTDYKIQIEKADQHADTTAHAVMASVQTIGRNGSDRILKFPKDHFGAVLIDEAHHCTAETYQNVIKYFCEDTKTILVGVTATPKRTDKESLDKVFDSVAINLNIVEGTKKNYLCPIVSHRVSSQSDLSQVRTTAGDFNLKDLSSAVDNKPRNTLIVETYKTRFPDKQALIFCTDVAHAFNVRDEFQSIGISAATVCADTPKDERRQIMSDFKSGKIMVLTNMNIATEGFNYQKLDLIIQTRPSKSPLLITQMMGRVSRLFEGKKVGHFVEIIDNHSEKTSTAAQIFGFKQIFDCEGHDFLECINKAQSLISEKDFFNPYNCNSWSDMLARFEISTPFNPRGFNEITEKTGGAEALDEEIYSEFNPNNVHYDSRYRYYYSGNNLKLLHTDNYSGYRFNIIAIPNGLGGFDVTMARKLISARKSDPSERVVSFRGANHADAIKIMEDYILENFGEWDRLLNVKAPWKKRAATEPCSDKQFAIISKNKLSNLPKEQISKFDAGELLSRFFNR